MMKSLLLFLGLFAIQVFAQEDSLLIKSEIISDSSEDSTCYFSVEYPQIEGLEDKEKETMINDFLYTSFTEETGDYDVSECDSLNPFTLDESYSVKLNSKSFLSLQMHYYSYTGGAHGNYGSTSLNINIPSGDILPLSDVIKPDQFDKLKLLIEEKIMEMYSAKTLTEAGLFDDSISVTGDQDYFITPSSLVIQYDPYEIASYAQGEIEVELKFDKIKDLINPEVPFYFLLKND